MTGSHQAHEIACRHCHTGGQVREDAAAELGLDVPAFIAALAETRQMGLLKPHE
jgi:hypothetical protein